jgi:hypothetical protein
MGVLGWPQTNSGKTQEGWREEEKIFSGMKLVKGGPLGLVILTQ